MVSFIHNSIGDLHLRELTENILGEMVDVIVRAIDPERIILFGSRARGDGKPDSDVDFLIVDSHSTDEVTDQETLPGNLSNTLRKFRLPIDLLLFSPEEIELWRESRFHVIGTALREGRMLYERT